MRKLRLLAALAAIVAVGCQQENFDVVHNAPSVDNNNQSIVRDYYEALAIAEEAVAMVDNTTTRSSNPRKIMSSSGQIVYKAVTRGGETAEEPIMYVFNNENNEGFTIVAADRSRPALIAATEQGNYTYGEPTGVEPFDLMMEDVARGLIIFPGTNLAIKEEIENEFHNKYDPQPNIQWGVESIYGSLYPDNIAYDEAAAIAQTLVCNSLNISYVVTNPNSSEYGQSFSIDSDVIARHVRYDHPIFDINDCTTAIHNHIARLYLEIGYRLSANSGIALSNKITSFPLAKVKSVLDSFGQTTNAITAFTGNPILPVYHPIYDNYNQDLFMLRGTTTTNVPNGGTGHTWIANGFDRYTYDKVTYTLNSILNPSHPNPNGYTETSRESCCDYMLYFNWGYDGISNGWFHSGCFDMSGRVDTGTSLTGNTAEYNYNFSNISYFRISDTDPITM